MEVHLTAAGVAILLALVGNAIALVWGAAKLSSSVDRLERITERVADQVNRHETRITVLEDRTGVEP